MQKFCDILSINSTFFIHVMSMYFVTSSIEKVYHTKTSSLAADLGRLLVKVWNL